MPNLHPRGGPSPFVPILRLLGQNESPCTRTSCHIIRSTLPMRSPCTSEGLMCATRDAAPHAKGVAFIGDQPSGIRDAQLAPPRGSFAFLPLLRLKGSPHAYRRNWVDLGQVLGEPYCPSWTPWMPDHVSTWSPCTSERVVYARGDATWHGKEIPLIGDQTSDGRDVPFASSGGASPFLPILRLLG